jgi:RNA polymerase sigma-70 factor, ECF subfamily
LGHGFADQSTGLPLTEEHGGWAFIPGTKTAGSGVMFAGEPVPGGHVAETPVERAFREGAVEHLDGLYGFALSLCRDRVAAEDLVQETYLRALKAPRKAEAGPGMKSWLFAILHNVWRNELRRRRPAGYVDEAVEQIPSDDPGPLDVVDRQQAGSRVLAAIEELPDPFREAIVLRCVEGFSYQEMAEVVGCPAGTIMSRLARARALLRRALGPARLAVAAGSRS